MARAGQGRPLGGTWWVVEADAGSLSLQKVENTPQRVVTLLQIKTQCNNKLAILNTKAHVVVCTVHESARPMNEGCDEVSESKFYCQSHLLKLGVLFS